LFSYDYPIKIKCCGEHDEKGYQCTKPIIEPEFSFNQNKNQLARCLNHFDQLMNQCDTFNYFTSYYQYFLCTQPKKIINNIEKKIIEKQYIDIKDKYSKCQYFDNEQC
jgi:hypothetical protein